MGRVDTYPVQSVQPVATLLGYAEITSSSTSTASGTTTDIPGLSVTVTVPAGRRLRITGKFIGYANTLPARVASTIREGTTVLGNFEAQPTQVGMGAGLHAEAIVSPSAGSHTYTVAITAMTNTGFVYADASLKGWIMVEDITGQPGPVGAASVPAGVLAWAESPNDVAAANGVETAVTGASVNVVVPAGRTLKLTGHFSLIPASGQPYIATYFKEGAAYIFRRDAIPVNNAAWTIFEWSTIISPPAGSHTYNLAFTPVGAGASAQAKTRIVVEDITATPAPANTSPSSTLGYAEQSSQTTFTTTDMALPGMSVTVTVPAGRRLRITASSSLRSSVTNDLVRVKVLEDGAEIGREQEALPLFGANFSVGQTVVRSPSAGAHTYTMVGARVGGSGTITADIGPAAFILVEDITSVSTFNVQPGSVQPGTFQAGDYVWPANSSVWGQGTPGTNFDWLKLSKAGAPSASNIMYAFSHRSNNTELWVYGYNGSSFGAGQFTVQPYFATAQGATIAGDLVVNGTGYHQFAGRMAGAGIGALKTVGIASTGIYSGDGAGFTGRCKNNGNNFQHDWNSGFQHWVDVTHVKTFVIPHPTDDERYLVHACVEGPESVVFYRGQAQLEGGWVRIDLPDYFEALCAEEGRTVMLTCIADDPADEWCPVLHATYPKNGHFYVGLGSGMVINDQRFWWEVKAVRKDVPALNVEPLTDTVRVYGDGPYTYYEEN